MKECYDWEKIYGLAHIFHDIFLISYEEVKKVGMLLMRKVLLKTYN